MAVTEVRRRLADESRAAPLALSSVVLSVPPSCDLSAALRPSLASRSQSFTFPSPPSPSLPPPCAVLSMLPSSSEPVLIEGPVSKRGKSVAGIGLWWKTRYVRLTSSFLTITDLKLQTLFASVSTADLLFCAPVKTRRSTGRRFLIRLTDDSVLQFATLTPNECVQWVTVINGVIAVCEKQRAKDTLAWQRKKEAALHGGGGGATFAMSSPNLTQGFHPYPSPSGPTHTPDSLHPTAVPPAPAQARAQTLVALPSQPTTGAAGQSGTAGGALAPVEGGLTRASSTGAVMERHDLERRVSRTVEQGRAQGRLQSPHQGKAGGKGRGDSAGKEERRARVNWEPNSSQDSPLRSASRRRDSDSPSQYSDEDRDRRYYDRYSSSREGSEAEYERPRQPPRHYGYPPYPMYLPPPPPFSATAPAVQGPPFTFPSPPMGGSPLGRPPAQRLLFFSLLFLLFSATILISGHTYRTTNQLTSLYHRHVTSPNATLHSYAVPVGQALDSWPLIGLTISGLYLLYQLQEQVLRGKGAQGDGDEVDWLGGGMAAVVCTYCMHAASLHLKAYLQAFGINI